MSNASWTPTPESRRPWSASALTAIALGLLGALADLFGSLVGIEVAPGLAGFSGMFVMSVLARSVAVSVVVVAVVWAGVRVAGRGDTRWWVTTAAVGYVLNVFSWTGNAMIVGAFLTRDGQFTAASRIAGFLGDLMLWCLLARLATGLGLRAVERRGYRVRDVI